MSQAPLGYNSSSAPKSSGLAIASMVLGIISIPLFCSPFLSFPAQFWRLVLGAIARSKVSRGEGGGGGMAMAGIVCGLISILLAVVLIAGFLSFLHFGGQRCRRQFDAAKPANAKAVATTTAATSRDQPGRIASSAIQCGATLPESPVELSRRSSALPRRTRKRYAGYAGLGAET